MNEVNQMHRELMNVLLPIVPRTVYHDIRRVRTLVWAMIGLYLTQTVRLMHGLKCSTVMPTI